MIKSSAFIKFILVTVKSDNDVKPLNIFTDCFLGNNWALLWHNKVYKTPALSMHVKVFSNALFWMSELIKYACHTVQYPIEFPLPKDCKINCVHHKMLAHNMQRGICARFMLYHSLTDFSWDKKYWHFYHETR